MLKVFSDSWRRRAVSGYRPIKKQEQRGQRQATVWMDTAAKRKNKKRTHALLFFPSNPFLIYVLRLTMRTKVTLFRVTLEWL